MLNDRNRVGTSHKCCYAFHVSFAFLVPFWGSIRVAVAFVGFIGMLAHYSQKVNVGIALVCMVNHSAIDYQKTSVAMPLTQADIDCPRLSNAVKIVNISLVVNMFFSDTFIGRSISLDKEYSRYHLRRLFLGIFDY